MRAPLYVLRELTQLSPDEDRDAAIEIYTSALAEQGEPLRAAARKLGIATLVEQKVADDAEHAASMLDSAMPPVADWPEPIPLREVAELPSFPLAALPGWLHEWVRAEAHATQTPPDMAAMLALAAVSTACARRIIVQVRPGWREPVCLYTIVVLPPGERKSAVFRDATAPIEAFEAELAERTGPEVDQASAAHRTAGQALRAAEQRAARDGGAETIAALRDAVDAEREARLAIPSIPRLVAADATPEALARLIAAHGGRIAVMDAEGCGPIAIALGRYSAGGSANLDVYLRAHAGDPIRVDRSGSEARIVRDPCLTLALTTQPEVLRQLGERREVRGLGFLARVLWCLPTSHVGHREVRPKPMPRAVADAYARHLRTLLAMEPADDGSPRVIELSPEADDMLAAYQAEIEPQLAPGGDLEPYRDWAGKLPGAVARIAALLHAASSVSSITSVTGSITRETMAAAITLGRYLLSHARLALGAMACTDPAIDAAAHVLDWLRAREVRTIPRRELHRGTQSRFRRSEDLDAPLAILADRGWIRIREVPRPGAVSRTDRHIDVSPRARDARDARDARAMRAPSVTSVTSVTDGDLV